MPALTKSAYNVLVHSIIDIYIRAQARTHQALDQIRAQTYWDIGRQIVKIEQKNNILAKYGEYLTNNLSKKYQELLDAKLVNIYIPKG